MRVHHSEKVAYNYFFLANKIANKNFKIQSLPSHPRHHLLPQQLPSIPATTRHPHIFTCVIHTVLSHDFQYLLQNSSPHSFSCFLSFFFFFFYPCSSLSHYVLLPFSPSILLSTPLYKLLPLLTLFFYFNNKLLFLFILYY